MCVTAVGLDEQHDPTGRCRHRGGLGDLTIVGPRRRRLRWSWIVDRARRALRAARRDADKVGIMGRPSLSCLMEQDDDPFSVGILTAVATVATTWNAQLPQD